MQRTFFTLLTIILSANISFAQVDCAFAIPITSNAPITMTPGGAGIDDFGCSPTNSNFSGCLATGEQQPVWFYFEMSAATPPNSPLGFAISPTSVGDYDFALYGPNVDCNSLGGPISCDYNVIEVAGLSNPVTTGFQPLINVNPGQGYFLLVSNFSQNSSGFNLVWTESAPNFFNPNPMPPSPCNVDVNLPPVISACPEDAPIALNPGSGTGGGGGCYNSFPTYSWTGTGASFLSATNIPNPVFTIPPTPGTYNLVLTAQDGGSCFDNGNITVNVVAPQAAIINPPSSSICIGGNPVLLTANPPGGTWSINAPNGFVDPSSPFITPGPNTITYNYTDQLQVVLL